MTPESAKYPLWVHFLPLPPSESQSPNSESQQSLPVSFPPLAWLRQQDWRRKPRTNRQRQNKWSHTSSWELRTGKCEKLSQVLAKSEREVFIFGWFVVIQDHRIPQDCMISKMFMTVIWKVVQFLFWSKNPLSDNSNSTSANGTAMLRWKGVKGWWLSMIIVDQWSYWGLSWCLKRQARRKSVRVKSKSYLSNSFEAIILQ